jgi:hypothetical protein
MPSFQSQIKTCKTSYPLLPARHISGSFHPRHSTPKVHELVFEREGIDTKLYVSLYTQYSTVIQQYIYTHPYSHPSLPTYLPTYKPVPPAVNQPEPQAQIRSFRCPAYLHDPVAATQRVTHPTHPTLFFKSAHHAQRGIFLEWYDGICLTYRTHTRVHIYMAEGVG